MAAGSLTVHAITRRPAHPLQHAPAAAVIRDASQALSNQFPLVGRQLWGVDHLMPLASKAGVSPYMLHRNPWLRKPSEIGMSRCAICRVLPRSFAWSWSCPCQVSTRVDWVFFFAWIGVAWDTHNGARVAVLSSSAKSNAKRVAAPILVERIPCRNPALQPVISCPGGEN